MEFKPHYIHYIYNLLVEKTEGVDAIYEDYILDLIGTHGFESLIELRLLEGCGSIHGRKLYTICGPIDFVVDFLKDYEKLLEENKQYSKNGEINLWQEVKKKN